MNIYFACSLTGGRDDEKIYQDIIAHLLRLGHQIPTAFLAQTNIREKESNISPSEIYLRDTTWIHNCDSLIAEISTPSHGVGFEIGFALNLNKPVLCLHHGTKLISKMVSGNPNHLLTIYPYTSSNEAFMRINHFLAH